MRRVRQVASAATAGSPAKGRVLPGMPLEFEDPDEDGEPRGRRQRFSRFDEPKGPWWRPTSKAGRIFFGLGALAVLGGVSAACLTLKMYLERDSRFRISGTQNIQATGLVEVNRAEMLPVFGEDIGRNIFFVPLSLRRKQLEEIPWVQEATVMRLLPDQIRISILEREPVAFTRRGSTVGLVDANGVLLSMPAAAMARHHYSFPVLTGIDRGDSSEARRTRVAVYLRLMQELDAGGQKNSEQLSEIDLTDPEDARVTMPEQGADILAHFGEDHFLERYQRYKSHIAEWRQQYPHLAAVDLRYDQQVVLQMASGTETATGTPGIDQGTANSAAGATKKVVNPKNSGASKSSARPVTKNQANKSSTGTAGSKKKQQVQKKSADGKNLAMTAKQGKPSGKPAQPAHSVAVMAQGG
jgi:cell division protein FtsQ